MAQGVCFEWGPVGARAVADAEVVVVADVLSFTTTLTVALDAAVAEVLPYRFADPTADAYAREHDAEVAVGRRQAAPGRLSLSPATLRARADPPRRLVLPSPNGSAIAHALAVTGATVVGACLRNASAVAAWIVAQGYASVAVIAAGERWPDGSLRPAVEDLWGAGAVIAGLGLERSPEASAAAAAVYEIRGRERASLHACASGRELAATGFGGDVDIAAEVDATTVVPVLLGDRFVAG